MKKMKKLVALIIATAMVLAMALPTIAATVEIKESDDYVADRSFKAYEVFTGNWEGGTLTNLAAGDGIDWTKVDWDAVKAISGLEDATDAVKLAAALDGKSTEVGKQIAKILKDAVTGGGIAVTNGGTLDDGYYIIIDETELGENDVANAALLQVAGDKVTINVKTDKPSVVKKIDGDKDADEQTAGLVDTNNGQVNDLVPYVITSTVPDTTYYDKYYMEFNDKVSAGLDISASDATGDAAFSDYKVYVDNTEMDATKYSLTVDATAKTIKVAFTDVKGMDGKVLKLTYKAKINKDAVVGTTGNPNEVTLKYTNSPDHSGDGEYNNEDYTSETPKDVVITYLTGIQILKIDAKDETPLEGAEFQITGSRDISSKVTGVRFVEDAEGSYYKLANGAYTETAWTDATKDKYDTAALDKKFKKENFTEVTTETQQVKVSAISGADGIIKFNELGAGEYTITEVVAPNGYNKLESPIKFKITYTAPTGEIATGTETCTWDKEAVSGVENVEFDATTGLFKIKVENNSGSTLPSTGGIGTTIFYVIGAILVIGAGVVLVTRRRMEA